MTVSSIVLILEILSVAGILVLIFLVRGYLPTYVTEKGKNLATKEDIAEITRQIEGAKAEYTHELEAVRAAIGSRLGIHQFRYQREYDLLSHLAEKVIELR